jgi:hypothetical protein
MKQTKVTFAVMCALLVMAAGACGASAYAQSGDNAERCIQVSTRQAFGNSYYSLTNGCNAQVIVYFVAENPRPGDTNSGNTYLSSGETFRTYIRSESGIQNYVCFSPKIPLNSDGHTPHRPNESYSCK